MRRAFLLTPLIAANLLLSSIFLPAQSATPSTNDGVREPWFRDRDLAPDAPTPEAQSPQEPKSEPTDTQRKKLADRTLIDNLKGIYLSTEIDATKPGTSGVQWGEVPEELEKAPLEAIAESFLNRPASLNNLNDLAKELKEALNAQGYLVADFISPRQSLKDSTVRYIILIGKAETFLVNGAEPPAHLAKLLHIEQLTDQPLTQEALSEELAILNWNPVRQAQLIFRKGSDTGYVNIDYQVREPERPFRLYGGFENSGNDTTMDERLYAGLTLWRNPIHDAIFNFEYRAAPTRSVSETYSGYLSFRESALGNTLSLFAAHSKSRPMIQPFNLEGLFEQIGLRYRIDHPSDSQSPLSRSSLLGFDWKSSNSDLQFGGIAVSSTTYQVWQFLLQHTLTRPDKYGYSQLTLGLTHSPGDINDKNENATFQATQAGTESTYSYLTTEFERSTTLNKHFRWALELNGQYSWRPLISSERLGVGGKGSVRGYEEYEATVDSGLIMRNTLHKSAIRLNPLEGQVLMVKPYLFWDYAFGSTRGTANTPARPLTLNSVGTGADFNLGQHLSAYALLGTQLHDSGRSDGRRNNKLHFGMRIDY